VSKLQIRLGSTSNILRIFLADSASTTGQGKTGLTFSSSGLIISTIADVEASPTTYTSAGSTVETITTLGTFAAPTATKCRFKEIDSTNFPGVYELQIADARWAVTNAKKMLVSVLCTGVAQTFAEIQQDPAPSDIRAVAGDVTAPGNLALAYNGTGYVDGTAQAGAAGTITLAAGSSATDHFYEGFLIQPVGGTGGGQSPRLCVGYVGSTKVATVRPNWTTTPDSTTTYELIPACDLFRAVQVESVGTYTAQQVFSLLLAACCGANPTAGTMKTPDNSTTRIATTVSATAPFRGAVTTTPSS
jgi:hypothetical protein